MNKETRNKLMDNLLNETTFEEHIAKYLANSDLYDQRSSAQFSIENLCDEDMLEQFLRQQPVVWAKLVKHFPGQEVATVIREYNKRIDRGESILTIMRKGFTVSGAKVKFCQSKPVLDGEDTDNYRLYRANRFSVVRQMRYSIGADSGNELDLCILLNGIPLFTFELKNEGTGQNYTHGILQYKRNRDPQNRMLRNCLVHFVMDNEYAFMTTLLRGEETSFLPFNREAVNPPIDGEYPSAYMSDAEVDAAIKVVVALYLYVTACSITDLEMAGCDASTTKTIPYNLPDDDSQVKMAAEDVHDGR